MIEEGFALTELKRILSLVMALLLLISSLLAVACSKDESEETEATTVEATAADGEQVLEAPPVENFDGKTCNILTLTGSSLLAGVDGDSEAISNALVERTNWIQDTYNVKMQLSTVDDGNDYIALQNSYLGGLREYDMVVPHPTKYLATMMASGMMQDLGACEEIDLAKPWWNQSQVENYNIQGKLFFGVSDFNLNKRGFSVIIVNQDRFKALFDDDIYELVDEGKWTFDAMKEYAIAAAEPSTDPEVAVYGLSINASVSGFYYWAGETLLKRNDEGNLELKFDVDKCSNIAAKVSGIVSGDHCLKDQYYNNTFVNSMVWKALAGGRLLMTGIDLGAHGHMLRDLSFETAYAPPPKFDEAQSSYTQICSAGFVGIPNDAKDLHFSALLLEALNWHSYYNFRPAYFDTYMSYIVSKNANDYRMLELVLDNTVYDLGFVLDSQGVSTGLALGMLDAVVMQGEGVASYIQTNEKVANNNFQNIIKDIY